MVEIHRNYKAKVLDKISIVIQNSFLIQNSSPDQNREVAM